jgi:Fe2+ transport system protein FeoA
MTLDQLQLGKRARVIGVHGGRGLRRNLTQMGVHPGDIVYLTQGGCLWKITCYL